MIASCNIHNTLALMYFHWHRDIAVKGTKAEPGEVGVQSLHLTLPVGTATGERSFSQMKLVKTRLHCRLNDANLAQLMQIVVEGPQLFTNDFNGIVDI